MREIRTSFCMHAAALLACAALLGQAPARGEGADQAGAVCFISDCQQPLSIETLLHKPYRNEEARDSLFADIIRQKPAQVFLLGDLTSSGRDRESWTPIDSFLCRLSGISAQAHAIPGNHEYIFNAQKGIANFKQRFPGDSLLGYGVYFDSMAVVMLNSNFDELTGEEVRRQQRWYCLAMDSLEKDSGVKAIVVCSHHAPYTNSTVVGPSKQVVDHFAPLFFASSKARLFMSGHSHNLELFEPRQGKFFLVLGGGGGLAQPLLSFRKEKFRDLIPREQRPLYFYITLRRDHERLMIGARGFGKDFGVFRRLEIKIIPCSTLH